MAIIQCKGLNKGAAVEPDSCKDLRLHARNAKARWGHMYGGAVAAYGGYCQKSSPPPLPGWKLYRAPPPDYMYVYTAVI